MSNGRRRMTREECEPARRSGRMLEDGVSLLAGAGIGVALMYLLDPEHGAQRRRYAKRRAQELVESTGATLSTALGATAGGASKLSSRVRDRVSDAYDTASDYASDAGSNASSTASGLFG